MRVTEGSLRGPRQTVLFASYLALIFAGELFGIDGNVAAGTGIAADPPASPPSAVHQPYGRDIPDHPFHLNADDIEGQHDPAGAHAVYDEVTV